MEKCTVPCKNAKLYYVSIIPVVVGIITFLIIYGLTPLNVTNDNWIMSGYDEFDIFQHYAGWLAFRNSKWAFPLGMADQMAVGVGTIISFTDSIPIVAIIFKLFRNVLPETFQYFGLFTLTCYILQSIAAFKILMLETEDVIYSTIGTLLFSFAPVFLERAFRHTALGAQWLILFSIYLYLKYCIQEHKNVYLYFMILEVLAIGIHPYFLPMVGCFVLLCVIRDVRKKYYYSIIYLFAIQIITCLFGYVIGALGSGVEVYRTGYGYYSMNLNAMINPSSCGQYTWSSILKPLSQTLGNYDGFNYLGAGVLLLGIVVVLLIFFMRQDKLVFGMVKRQIFLVGICIILTCFAISNVVTYSDRILFTVPFPEFLSNVCSIFRASSRMFYPVYYIIFLTLIILLWRILKDEKKKCAYAVLGFIVLLQIFDLHRCIMEKHRFMNEKASYVSYIDDMKLKEIGENAESILLEEIEPIYKITLPVWAFKNNMATYYSVANSGDYGVTNNLSDELLAEVKETGNIGKNVIVTNNSEIVDLYDQYENISVYNIDDIYFIYNNGENEMD